MKAAKYILWGGLVLLGGLLLWGLFEPYLDDVEPYDVTVKGLPSAWEGQEIALISDWQVGMWMDNEPTIEEIIRMILERQPALVLITGDFVYKPEDPQNELARVRALLQPLLETDIPVYAVLGNHDYGVTRPTGNVDSVLARTVRRRLENAGVSVLTNGAVPLAPPSSASRPDTSAAPLYLVGLGPHWPGRDDVSAALAEVPSQAPRLVMMHNPTTFGSLPAQSAPLAVAGHTHGGQVRLPFTPAWTWLTYVKTDAVHGDGWIEGYGRPGNRLYVNRGIGLGLVPLRINCIPELTVFTLRAAS